MNKEGKILMIASVMVIVAGLLYLLYDTKAKAFKEKEAELKAARTTITDLKMRLSSAEADRSLLLHEYGLIVERLKKAQYKKQIIHPPVTNMEARERFTKLGYPPNAKD